MFFGGVKSGSEELPKDNSSSTAASLSLGKIGSLPLFYLTRGAGCCSLLHFHPYPLPNELVGDRSLAADSQHGSAIQPFVWVALLASSLDLDASEETGPQGTNLLGYWP